MKKFGVVLGILLSAVAYATVNAPSAMTGKGGFTSPTTTKGDLIVRNSTIDTRIGVGADGLVLTADSSQATGVKWGSVAGTGDVVGPASATDNAVCRFDGTTGKAIQNSGSTLDDSGFLEIPNTGGIGVGATPSATLIQTLRRDRNGALRSIVSNQDTGSSAYSLFSVASDAGDFSMEADSVAGGALAQLRTDPTFTAGLRLSAAGNTPLDLYTNGTSRFTISGAGDINAKSQTTITGSSGPMLIVKDGGTAGVNADPHLSFYADATEVGRVGFLTANGLSMSFVNTQAGSLLFNTNGKLVANVTSAGLWTLGENSGNEAHAINGKLAITPQDNLPFSVTGTSSAGTVRFLNPAASGKYNWVIGGQYNVNNGFEITPSTATDGSTFSTPIFQATQAGVLSLGASGGTQTHEVNGDMTISGLTASKVMLTNGSKKLISSTMSQTTLEALTGEQIDGLIESPAATTYILRLNAKYAGTINNISIKTSAGTITAKLQIEGVDVTSCTGIAVTSTESTTTCTAANSVAAGDTITLVTSSLSSALNLAFSIGMTRN